MRHLLSLRLRFLVCVSILACVGCADRDQKADEVQQSTANVAAGIYEAAVAIEQGADPQLPLSAIKLGANAIIHAQGRQYPPADAWIDGAVQEKKQ